MMLDIEKVAELVRRCNKLVLQHGVSKTGVPTALLAVIGDLRIGSHHGNVITVTFQGWWVYKQKAAGGDMFIYMDVLDEALEFVRQRMVLDDLADV